MLATQENQFPPDARIAPDSNEKSRFLERLLK